MTSVDAFWEKVDASGICWLWLGTGSGGYGAFRWMGKMRQAHRLAYELLVGPVPADRELDHLCRVRRCVNPDHLEPVTHRTNVLRGYSIVALQHVRPKPLPSHCKRGHPFDAENTGSSGPAKNGRRRCRTCHRDDAWASRQAIGIPARTRPGRQTGYRSLARDLTGRVLA